MNGSFQPGESSCRSIDRCRCAIISNLTSRATRAGCITGTINAIDGIAIASIKSPNNDRNQNQTVSSRRYDYKTVSETLCKMPAPFSPAIALTTLINKGENIACATSCINFSSLSPCRPHWVPDHGPPTLKSSTQRYYKVDSIDKPVCQYTRDLGTDNPGGRADDDPADFVRICGMQSYLPTISRPGKFPPACIRSGSTVRPAFCAAIDATHYPSVLFGVLYTVGALTAYPGWRCSLLSFLTNVRLPSRIYALRHPAHPPLTAKSHVLSGHVLLHSAQSPVRPFTHPCVLALKPG